MSSLTKVVSVRLTPEVLGRLRAELGMPSGVPDSLLMRRAVARITGISEEELRRPIGGARPGAGRPRKRRPEAA